MIRNIRNNWDLSALRAIERGAGYLQEQVRRRPEAPHSWRTRRVQPASQPTTTEVGKQRNRRTQIIITPKLDQFMDLIDKAPENE